MTAPKSDTISGDNNLLRNADIGHMLELRERMSELERENSALREKAEEMARSIEGATPKLIENIEEWASHFRENQHGATLTILRVLKLLRDQEYAVSAYRSHAKGSNLIPACPGGFKG